MKRLIALACLLGCGDPASQALEPPQLMNQTPPFVYPIELWDHNISGQTILALKISELGAVDSVLISTSSGFEEFDSAAVVGARQLQFSAGKQGDRRVPMWTKLPVRFSRDTLSMGLGTGPGKGQ